MQEVGRGGSPKNKTASQGRWSSTSEIVDKVRRKDVMGEVKNMGTKELKSDELKFLCEVEAGHLLYSMGKRHGH